MNVRPSAMAAKSEMMTIWLVWETIHTPSIWLATVDES